MKSFRFNLLILLSLFLVGLIVHLPSLSLSLYGDDWLSIYLYFTREDPESRFGPLPGPLTFLTPYGPSVLLITTLFKFFHTNYSLYYVVALFFKLLDSYSMYLAAKEITKDKFFSLILAIFFLVGFSGLQTTDWVFYMNIYLAIGAFLLGLFFKLRFFQRKSIFNLYLSLLMDILSIVIAPVRLYPVVFLSPLSDLLLYFNGNWKGIKKTLIYKNLFFISAIIILWKAGMFGGSYWKYGIYSPGNFSISDFWNIVKDQPIETVKSFFQWIGVMIVPTNLIYGLIQVATGTVLLGSLITIVFLKLLRSDKKDLSLILLGGILFFLPLVAIWWYSPLRHISSEDRYLMVAFANFCLLISVLYFVSFKNLKKIIIILVVFLITINIFATQKMYRYWLVNGRSAAFARIVDQQIANDFPKPVTSPKIIYIESDNNVILHSIQFGLLFKINALTGTWKKEFFNQIYNDKSEFVKYLSKEIVKGKPKADLIESVYAYQYKNNKFSSVTKEVRKELYNKKL